MWISNTTYAREQESQWIYQAAVGQFDKLLLAKGLYLFTRNLYGNRNSADCYVIYNLAKSFLNQIFYQYYYIGCMTKNHYVWQQHSWYLYWVLAKPCISTYECSPQPCISPNFHKQLFSSRGSQVVQYCLRLPLLELDCSQYILQYIEALILLSEVYNKRCVSLLAPKSTPK